ncbi:hypothetical protein CYMTET_49938 [Cymbomonas tetramitiformis]|uniref:Uncharacterized protein n=1 Tax=Cymbomonas tetramitiformis TaxID=36881 RepID=A0AAE0BR62_9CHLO|nr:hypothetical protein CYMTET_49938 [Cymbomonas tetramitiformis]
MATDERLPQPDQGSELTTPGTEGFVLTVAEHVCTEAGVKGAQRAQAEILALIMPGLKPNSRSISTLCSDVVSLLNERLHGGMFWTLDEVVKVLRRIAQESGNRPSKFCKTNKRNLADPFITPTGVFELLCHPVYTGQDDQGHRRFLRNLIPTLVESARAEAQRFKASKSSALRRDKVQGRVQREDMTEQRKMALLACYG